MIVERSLQPQFVSNTYLVADRPGGTAVLIDAGGPVEPLMEKIDELGVTLDRVLLTHHHHDHVAELDKVLERHPRTPVLAHPDEPVEAQPLEPDTELTAGDLRIRALHTPGHTAGMLSFLVSDADGAAVFTGDTLFRGSVGGVRAPGHTTYEDLRRSIMEILLALPPETRIYPGHTDATTVAEELERNPFVRIWRGEDPEGEEACRALGQDATLILRARDYDGGTKAWVRWPDGSDDIVPGSAVEAP